MISIYKGTKKNEEELTMNFVRDIIFEKMFGDVISLLDGHRKEEFMNT